MIYFTSKIILFLLLVKSCEFVQFFVSKPVIKATKGEIWPRPKFQMFSDTFFTLNPKDIKFKVIGGHNCDILAQAIEHYQSLLEKEYNGYINEDFSENFIIKDTVDNTGNFSQIEINLKSFCEKLPYLGMDEAYTLNVSHYKASLMSLSIWGMLRGLETFSQLFYFSDDLKKLMINETTIEDKPRYPHRGLLIDTSRHFISKKTLMKILDGMAYNKLNTFHWHIIDDHSFPYQSITYPELSEKGAYSQRFVYSQNDIIEIIEHARYKGIRVIPEFDTPGHTSAIGASHPEILTECKGKLEGKLGPINPVKNDSYMFLKNLFKELTDTFPEKYFHLGGDEVGHECWRSNREVSRIVKDYKMPNYKVLEGYYFQNLLDHLDRLNKNYIVWESIFENGLDLPTGTIVQIRSEARKKLLKEVTRQNYFAILSSCWFLNVIANGGDWRKFYDCDPDKFKGSGEDKKKVLGGEAIMWGGQADDSNIIQKIFPRVSAVAEALWSPINGKDYDEAKYRIEEHYCRMRKRGIQAQPPNGPGYCL